MDVSHHEIVLGFNERVVLEAGSMASFYLYVFEVRVVLEFLIVTFDISFQSIALLVFTDKDRNGYEIDLSPDVVESKVLDIRVELL